MSNIEKATITLHEITKCGLYKYKDSSQLILGNIETILDDLISWTKREGKTLSQTCTYALEDEFDTNKTFCYDILKSNITKNFLLITWNQTSDSLNNITTVRADKPVGEAKIQTSEINKNQIAGFPTYFYFISELNLLATVNFDSSRHGKDKLKLYIREFISKLSSYVVFEDEGDEIIIKGYKANPHDELKNLRAMFDLKIIKNHDQIDRLIDNYQHIVKIAKHNKLPITEVIKSGLIGSFANRIFGQQSPKIDTDLKFFFEYGYKPESQKELMDIINDWEKETTGTKWDNIGFQLKGEPNLIWLNDQIARNKFKINVNRDSSQVIETKDLLKWLDSIAIDIAKMKK